MSKKSLLGKKKKTKNNNVGLKAADRQINRWTEKVMNDDLFPNFYQDRLATIIMLKQLTITIRLKSEYNERQSLATIKLLISIAI